MATVLHTKTFHFTTVSLFFLSLFEATITNCTAPYGSSDSTRMISSLYVHSYLYRIDRFIRCYYARRQEAVPLWFWPKAVLTYEKNYPTIDLFEIEMILSNHRHAFHCPNTYLNIFFWFFYEIIDRSIVADEFEKSAAVKPICTCVNAVSFYELSLYAERFARILT